MSNITVEYLRSSGLSYDPVTGEGDIRRGSKVKLVTEDYEESLVSFLSSDYLTPSDRIGIVSLSNTFVSDKVRKLFAVSCLREALKLVKLKETSFKVFVDSLERYFKGLISLEELRAISEGFREKLLLLPHTKRSIGVGFYLVARQNSLEMRVMLCIHTMANIAAMEAYDYHINNYTTEQALDEGYEGAYDKCCKNQIPILIRYIENDEHHTKN